MRDFLLNLSDIVVRIFKVWTTLITTCDIPLASSACLPICLIATICFVSLCILLSDNKT